MLLLLQLETLVAAAAEDGETSAY